MEFTKEIKEYLNKSYQGSDSFIQEVIIPVFGEESYETKYDLNMLEDNPELSTLAKATGVALVTYVGRVNIRLSTIDIFDITVTDHVLMERNRVNVQRIIRRIMDTFSGAFMIFHYDDKKKWDWRFSFCNKRGSNDEATIAKRYTFLLGPSQSCRTAAENFNKLAELRTGKGFMEMKDIVSAFDVEALSDEFFEKYKSHYQRFVDYLCNPNNGMRQSFIDTHFDRTGMTAEQIFDKEAKPIRDYVKKMMGRIVFLHFLQKKGWMGVAPDAQWGEGNLSFMYDLFNKASIAQQDDFLDSILEPLFSDCLNIDRTANNDLFDTKIAALHNNGKLRIPYLNGGLFERSFDDEPDTKFPSQYFKDLFEFFYQYNFTIDENDPNDAQVGIDPEMLGRIFENLLEDNKDKGAFYTPKEIVQYMCRESLVAYLQTDQSDTDKPFIRAFVENHICEDVPEMLLKEIDKKLKIVKICDPAIGSGAFPMGLLKELFLCRGAIEHFQDPAKIKREIIKNNIYGVDIEKGAVDIARLRFWLSLVVDEETPHALPNMDFKIMQGNSLIESYNGVDLSRLMKKSDNGTLDFSDNRKEYLAKLICEFYEADNDTKERLRVEIYNNISGQISENGYNVSMTDIDFEANDQFFLWHTWFSEVFDTNNGTIDGDGGGFDIVIGNPPYVEAKKLKHIASKLKPLYSLYSGTADLSIYFFEIASKLLRPSGVICYISTNKFFNTLYGKSLRRLLRNMNIKLLINFEQVEVFKKVLVSSVIISFQKEAPAYNNKFIFEHFYKLSADEFKREFIGRIGQFGSYQQDYLDDDEWSFSDLDSIILKDKIRRTGTMIKDTAGISVFRGVTTGYNPAFIIGGATKDMLIGADANNSSIIKNLLQGRNIRKWYYNESDESLIFTRKGILIDRYPTIKKYLSAFYLDLRPRTNNGTESSGRKPGTYQWYEILDNTAYYRHFEQPEKIIWGLTADKWAFTIDSDGHYLPSNGYILTSTTIHIKYILGLLNSKLLHYYFTFIGVMTAGGAYTLKAATIESLPLALGSQIQQDEIVQYVSEILLLKYNNHDYDVTEIEDKIDNIVYDIYGLTKTEKEMLEQHLRK